MLVLFTKFLQPCEVVRAPAQKQARVRFWACALQWRPLLDFPFNSKQLASFRNSVTLQIEVSNGTLFDLSNLRDLSNSRDVSNTRDVSILVKQTLRTARKTARSKIR